MIYKNVSLIKNKVGISAHLVLGIIILNYLGNST